MTKPERAAHEQKLINNLNHKLFHIEMKIREGKAGNQLQRLECSRVRIEARLMNLYGTKKYGLQPQDNGLVQ